MFYTRPCMHPKSWMRFAAAAVSAALLELPFPIAGPMSPWRSIFAWFGLVPLLWSLLAEHGDEKKPLRRAFFVSYLCGFLWYAGNCYWVRDTMSRYGDMPPFAPTLLLIAFSLVLGLYFGAFGLTLTLVCRASGSRRIALLLAPFLWTALELAAARITSVPWDQLGYSQVDNGVAIMLAPWTGTYGVSFILVAANSALLALLVPAIRRERGMQTNILITAQFALALTGSILAFAPVTRHLQDPNKSRASAAAVLVQPNLDVGVDANWNAPGEWETQVDRFQQLAGEQCKKYIAGIPQTGAPTGEIICPPFPTHPDLVVWPESPAPFIQADQRFQQAATNIATGVQTNLVLGGLGTEYSADEQRWRDYNSAMVFRRDGRFVGRYDKIHLVPFGEYIPFKELLFFAHKLTGRVSEFSRGQSRETFSLQGPSGNIHRYGVFICYEAVFADEVRHFAANGAEALVNISDDGWYGDTSAPWQHFNMVRMRAIENRRWILRDTNNGVTAAIDPYGHVRQSISRHSVDALPAQYGFRSDVTFYSAHGDVFAWFCALCSIAVLGFWLLRSPASHRSRSN